MFFCQRNLQCSAICASNVIEREVLKSSGIGKTVLQCPWNKSLLGCAYSFDYSNVTMVRRGKKLLPPTYLLLSSHKSMMRPSSVTRFGNFLDFGQLLKPLAAINLLKYHTFLGKFCKGVKIFYSYSEIIFGQLL